MMKKILLSIIFVFGLIFTAAFILAAIRPLLLEITLPCIKSGDERTIQKKLDRGETVIKLCQNAVFELAAPLTFQKPNQRLFTEGYPSDDRRALFKIVSPKHSLAISAYNMEGAEIRNIRVDGNRRELGQLTSHALIMMGGNIDSQKISQVRAFDSRSWSTIHVNWGDFYKDEFGRMRNHCDGVVVTDNDLGPSGEVNEGRWSDGISVQCEKTIIKNNKITDVTDGGIVIFGAPGSIIENNQITSKNIPMKIGIALVDWKDYEGNYNDILVENNIIQANNSFITIGIAAGSRLWHCPREDFLVLNRGATIKNNQISGSNFGYGIAVNGVTDFRITDNKVSGKFAGKPSSSCGFVNAAPAAMVIDKSHSNGTFQSGFTTGKLEKIYDLQPL